jgi:hypothetical protein
MTTPSNQAGTQVPDSMVRAPRNPAATALGADLDHPRSVADGSRLLRQVGTAADALRAAADFIESAGLRSGLFIVAGDTEVRIHVSRPYENATARHAIVTRIAGLIGGTIRQDDQRDYASATLRADGAIGGLRTIVETPVLVRRARTLTGVGKPLAEPPGGQITAVPGKLPAGWRWVTELDARPKRAAPWKPRGTAATTVPAAEAPQLAARDCPPLTNAALQAAAQLTTAARPARPGSMAHRAPRQPPR